MESCVMAAVYLNYDDFCKRQNSESIHLLREIKILLLSPNRLMPSFTLPMIRMLTKQNKSESIREGIRKALGLKSKVMLKMTEVSLSSDKSRQHNKSLLIIVFLNSLGCEEHIVRSEFVSLSELSQISIGENSMDYISAIKKWMKTVNSDPNVLLDWFKPCKRGEVHEFKLKRTIIDTSLERPHIKKTELIHKSTSLESVTRSDFVNNPSPSRKQADSLDRITVKENAHTPMEIKNAIKSKIAKPKTLPNPGPISAIPLQETNKSNLVINNPYVSSQSDFSWNSDIVINNPFWNQQLDFTQIRVRSKSLFHKDNYVTRGRDWSVDFPLHHAAFKGDMLLVSSLVNNGCSCMERDESGWTPLHYAVWYGHLDMVSLFLHSQLVTVNCCTLDSLTPLHLALVNRQSAITNLLLKQPELDISLKTSGGNDARGFAEKYDKQFMIPLIKLVPPKLTHIQVNLMDNSVKSLILSNGVDTTFQQLHMQMIDMMNIPSSCFDVFSFWVEYRTQKYTGKNSLIPIECFGSSTLSLKDLTLTDYKLYWKRNVFLGLDKERKVKHALVLSLLFNEAVFNFTKKSRYPCDTKDISLLSGVLLYLHLSSTTDDVKTLENRRAFSLNRVNRPLSFVLGSKLNVQTRQMSASMQTLKDRPKLHYNASLFSDLNEKSSIIEERSRQAKTFLSSYKNLTLIMPKQKLKNSKINWAEEIIKRFLQSSLSFKNHTCQDRQYRFLTLCWNLTLYGCAYFHVEIKLNSSIPFTDCILAVNDMGIYFLHARTKNLIQNFKYSSITWHSNAANKCIVLFTKKNNIYIKTKQSNMVSHLMLKLHSINS